MAPPAAAAKKAKSPNATPINSELKKSGVMRLSRGRMFHKRGLWHIEKWRKTNEKKPEEKRPKKATRVTSKQVKGDKNGGERKVRAKRFPKSYPTEDKPKKLRTNRRKAFSQHKHSLRATITPGTVLILVAGRHAGKRVVFLKQLKSGLLLVSGPFKINGCPLRRVNQIYVIATRTKVDVSKVTVPENLDDTFFNRIKAKKQKPTDGEIFETKKEKYSVNDERKSAQVNVDKQLLAAIKAHPEKTQLQTYLKSKFSLSNKQLPHQMKF
jgi:large subunit ribosomal protein L6e